MVESERIKTGGMPNGRCMLRAIYCHFQLECDRVGMLAERNLLNIKVGGDGVTHLENFRDKYLYVATTIPVEDMPKESTLFNHLIDELEQVTILRPKVEKAREARPGSHRRTTEWLWNRVDIAIDLHQQRVNRQEFDKSLQAKPEALTSTSQPSKPNVPANPAQGAAVGAPQGGNPDKPRKEKKTKKKGENAEADVPATPAPKGGGKGKKGGKGDGTPRTPRTPKGDNTPRSAQAKSARNMTPEEKAKTPCMFWAFGACKGNPCPFLHDEKNKYTGPKPKSLAKDKPEPKGKAKAKAKANAATAPLVNAVPAELNQDGKITWLWDTAAGRRLIGRQALSSKALSCVTRSENPVGFATGGGAREGTHSLAFEGSRLLPGDEQVYVLKKCPPAFSVGKAVLDEGSLFVWDPRDERPFFVKKEDVHRCKLKIPRKARINATRVVEYVPQFDETLNPTRREPNPSLSPVMLPLLLHRGTTTPFP